MKTTIVPAQITTVEDKIAGNLGITQLILLVAPVFLGSAIFVMLPPLFKVSLLKTVIVGLLAIACIALSIRIKGVIVMTWLLMLVRYNSRPRHYVYNKNDSYLRGLSRTETAEPTPEIAQDEAPTTIPLLQPLQLVRAEMTIDDPRAKFHIRANRKGVLRAYLHEVKEETV